MASVHENENVRYEPNENPPSLVAVGCLHRGVRRGPGERRRSGGRTMASLIVVSSLFQFALAARLSLLRRIFTPVVAGTVIMLIAATVMPIVFDSLTDVPDGTSQTAAPAAALATIVVVGALVLRAPPGLRLWSPVIGIAVGCAVSAPFGLFDL